jgi:hypothetical protein
MGEEEEVGQPYKTNPGPLGPSAMNGEAVLPSTDPMQHAELA